MAHVVSLLVKSIGNEDVYRDRVRIPVVHRGTIEEGSVCRLSVSGKSVLTEVRGISTNVGDPSPGNVILTDEIVRGKLLIFTHQEYQFEIEEVGWLGQFIWAWGASDPTARIAARLGVLGFILGVIGAVLGLIALAK